MNQPTLFDVCARKHKGNAESAAANRRVNKQRDREKVFAACSLRGGTTCRELATLLGVGMNQISGRFSELKRDNRIKRIGTRDGCGVYVVTQQEAA